MEDCYLNPPCEDFINCDCCNKRVDIDDSYNISYGVDLCESCFEYALTDDINIIKKRLNSNIDDLLYNVLDNLGKIQKR